MRGLGERLSPVGVFFVEPLCYQQGREHGPQKSVRVAVGAVETAQHHAAFGPVAAGLLTVFCPPKRNGFNVQTHLNERTDQLRIDHLRGAHPRQ